MSEMNEETYINQLSGDQVNATCLDLDMKGNEMREIVRAVTYRYKGWKQ